MFNIDQTNRTHRDPNRMPKFIPLCISLIPRTYPCLIRTTHHVTLYFSKAYAKFYGSYAALETGFVHQALTAFTGAQSEEIFLATAGRGIGKKGLWKKMRRYQQLCPVECRDQQHKR